MPLRRVAAALSRLIRAGNWWNSKLPPLLAAVYGLALVEQLTPHQTLLLWGGIVATIFGVGAYGHVVNDAFDIEVDRLAGKPNAMARFRPVQRALIALVLLAIAFSPTIAAGFGPVALALVAVDCLLPTLYSAPPIRVKERGVWALLFDASAAHLIPTTLVAVAAAHYPGPFGPWALATAAALAAWALVFGLKGILIHQVLDRQADVGSGVETLAVRWNAGRVRRVEQALYLFEVALFVAVVALLAPVAPLLPVALMAYLPLELLKRRQGWELHFAQSSQAARYRPLSNSYFYELALPLTLAVHLAIRHPSLAWLPLAHLLLFRANVVEQWRDYQQLRRPARQRRRHGAWIQPSVHGQAYVAQDRALAGGLVIDVAAADGEAEHLKLCRGPWEIQDKQAYRLSFTASSEAYRMTAYGVCQLDPPWQGLGVDQAALIDGTPRRYVSDFVAAFGESQAVFYLWLGGAMGRVHLSRVRCEPLDARAVWRLEFQAPAFAQRLEAEPGSTDVHLEIVSPGAQREAVRLFRRGVGLRRGHHYRARLTARARQRRLVDFGVCQHGGQWAGLGLAEELVLTPSWQTFEIDFVADDSDPSACVYLWLGGEAGHVDVRDVAVVAIEALDAHQLIRRQGTMASLLAGEATGPRIQTGRRIQLPVPGKTPEHVRYCRAAESIRRGEYYVLRCEARAARPRRVGLGVSQSQEPFAGLGVSDEIDLTPQWQRFTRHFRGLRDEASPSLYLLVGGDDAAVEVRSLTVELDARPHPLVLERREGADADHNLDVDDAETTRVAVFTPGLAAHDLVLGFDRFVLYAGQAFEVRLRARSTGARRVRVVVCEPDEPWEGLGLDAPVTLTTTWQSLVLPFTALAARDNARVGVWLGAQGPEVELAEISLEPIGDELVWDLRCQSGAAAQALLVSDDPAARRICLIEPGSGIEDVQATYRVGAIQQAAWYRCTLRLRADQSQSVAIGLGDAAPPWEGLAGDVTWRVGPEWQRLVADFEALRDCSEAMLSLRLGSGGHVEVAEVEFAPLAASDWRLDVVEGCQAQQTRALSADSAGDAVEVRVDRAGGAATDLGLLRASLPVAIGEPQEIRFEARSEPPRVVIVNLQQAHAPWENLGLAATLRVDGQWRKFALDVLPERGEKGAAVRIDCGEGAGSLAIRDFSQRVARDDAAWFCERAGDARGDLHFLGDGARRVEGLDAGRDDDAVRVVRAGARVAAGGWHVLRFRARADTPRSIRCNVRQLRAPWNGLGLQQQLELTDAWQTFVAGFLVTADEQHAAVVWAVGGSAHAVEIERVSLAPSREMLPTRLRLQPAAQAVLVAIEGAEGAVRCVPLASRGDPADVQITRDGVELTAGQRYRARFEARADHPRRARIGVFEDHAPWGQLGWFQALELTPEWQVFSAEFLAPRDERQALLAVWAGESLIPLELRGFEWQALQSPASPAVADPSQPTSEPIEAGSP